MVLVVLSLSSLPMDDVYESFIETSLCCLCCDISYLDKKKFQAAAVGFLSVFPAYLVHDFETHV